MREKLKKGDIIEIKNKLFIYEILEIETEINKYNFSITHLEIQVVGTSLSYRYSIVTDNIDEYIKILCRGGKNYE